MLSTPPAPTPHAAVRVYVAAVNARSPGRLCLALAPQTRLFLSRGERSCRSALSGLAVFAPADPDHVVRFTGARILRLGRARRVGATTAVAVTARETFVCVSCRPHRRHFQRRRDVVYTLHTRRGWRVAQLSGLYSDAYADGSFPRDGTVYPPAVAADLRRPVRLPRPHFSCRGIGRTYADPPGDVQDDDYRRRQQPSVDLLGVRIVRTAPQTVCVALRLAARPRRDRSYALYHRESGDVITSTDAELEIDGRGGLHSLVGGIGALSYPQLRGQLPRWGWTGHELQVQLTRSRLGFRLDRLFSLQASSEVTEPGEPLLTHPAVGSDRAPDDACLPFPSGRVVDDSGGPCGAPAG